MSGRAGPPEALVHIGTAKTGTTALQHALLSAEAALRPLGVAYLPSPGHVNARELAAASVGPNGFDDHLDAIGASTPEQRRRFHDEVADRFARQVASAAGASRVVISSEHLHSRLTTASMVDRFLTLVGPSVGRIRVLCYLRPQAELVESFYSTHLRNGGTNSFEETVAAMLHLDSTYCNYELLLTPWADALGDDAIDVRIFDRSAFAGGSILTDAEAALGLPAGTLGTPSAVANQPVDPDGQRLLLRLNRSVANGDLSHEIAQESAQAVVAAFEGPGERLTQSRAAEVAATFGPSNERVRRRFRSDLDTLFAPGPVRDGRTSAVATADERSTIEATVAELLDVAERQSDGRLRRRWPWKRR